MKLQKLGKCCFTLLELIIVIGCFSLCSALLLPLYGRAVAGKTGTGCADHLRNIGMTLAFYADDNDDYLLSAFRIYPDDMTQNWLYYLHHEYKMKADALVCPDESDAFAFGKLLPENANPRLMHSYGMHYEAVQDNYAPPYTKFTRRNLQEHGQIPEAHILAADSVANATGSKPVIRSDNSALISSHGGYYSSGSGLTGSGWYPVGTRHENRANVLMFDGHVEALTGAQLSGNDLKYWKPMFYDWKWQN